MNKFYGNETLPNIQIKICKYSTIIIKNIPLRFVLVISAGYLNPFYCVKHHLYFDTAKTIFFTYAPVAQKIADQC